MNSKRLTHMLAVLAVPALAVLAAAPATAAGQPRPHRAASMHGYPSGHPAAARLIPAIAPPAAAGYVWSGDPSGGYYTYNSSGHAISVTANTPTAGNYRVSFSGLQAIGVTGDAQVTAYGTNDTCVIADWGNIGSTEAADVQCYTPAGVLDLIARDFDLTITKPLRAPSGVFDYSWVYNATGSGKLTGLGQYNTSHKVNQVKHLGTGRYLIFFPGPRSSGTRGTVEVTPFGPAAGDCVLAGWAGSRAGENIAVRCYSASGAPQNRRFDVVYASANNVLSVSRATDANALFSGQGGVISPLEHYYSARHAQGVAVQWAKGRYEVALAGSGGNFAAFGGDVQVEAVSTHDYHCDVVSWSQEAVPVIDVACTDHAGHAVRTPFALQWVVL